MARKVTTKRKLIVTAIAWTLGILIFFPILWTFLTSFKSEADAIASPPQFLFFHWTTENYAEVQSRSNYLSHFMVTDRGLAGLAFSDSGDERACLEDMTCRWPNAEYVEDLQATVPYAARIFEPGKWSSDQPLRVVLIGTDFQVRVWQSLLKIPFGKAVTYSDIANDIGSPTAQRAVGAAVGANPISFVVPCHRALGKNGALTGYHWGLTRKRAMLGWESAHA